jgi:hypothetical protein
MSVLTVDSQNFVGSYEAAPDKLRALIGKYYSQADNGSYEYRDISNIRIDELIITNASNNESTPLIPQKRNIISFGSNDYQKFETNAEWRDFCFSSFSQNSIYFDHAHLMDTQEVTSSMIKNFHMPEYEDHSKIYSTKKLLNYNLISYPFKSSNEEVRRVADRKTVYDAADYEAATQNDLDRLFSQFETRISNYSASVSELEDKQTHIYDIYSTRDPVYGEERFPYQYRIEFGSDTDSDILDVLDEGYKRKNVFKSIRTRLVESELSFSTGENTLNLKVHDFLSICTSNLITNFSKSTDELYLLDEDENASSPIQDRFVNHLRTIQFFSSMRSLVEVNFRDYNDTTRFPKNCHTSLIGYKIQKYFDRESGTPIQTYYTTNSEFIDTQLKYGRKYFYVVHRLYAVFGTQYEYKNLLVQDENGKFTRIDGTELPSGLPAQPTSNQYNAMIEVVCRPSVQIIEEEIYRESTCFVDSPILPPEVMFYGRKSEPTLNMFFRPSFFKIESVTSESDEELGRELLTPFRDSDAPIISLLRDFSKDNTLRGDYFSGIYEIYRMEEKPTSYLDFKNHFLTSVDMFTDVMRQNRNSREQLDPKSHPILGPKRHSNHNAHFQDTLVPHRVYYYLFRAVTYHGTPSNVTVTYRVELQRDSDEYKLVIDQYRYPTQEDLNVRRNFKRILNIVPNEDRLQFTFPEDKEPSYDNWSLDGGGLFSLNAPKIFKLRVRSKHTGKIVDLNLRFKLKKDNSFTP